MILGDRGSVTFFRRIFSRSMLWQLDARLSVLVLQCGEAENGGEQPGAARGAGHAAPTSDHDSSRSKPD